MPSNDQYLGQPLDGLPRLGAVSRRALLKAGAAGAALGVTGALSGGEVAWSDVAASADLQPKRGGRLRVGHVGGGVSETLDPHKVVYPIDNARAVNLFDRLTRLKPDLSVQLELAESFEPNSKATEWTVRLRSGVIWHDGKPLTAEDLIYTLRRISAPKNALVGASTVALIDVPGLKKLDNLTVRMPLKQPIAILPTFFTSYFMEIVRDGATSFKHPVGTGAFVFKSFTPGQSSLFVRNPNFWLKNQPHVDELEILSIPDQGARLNALVGGEVDAIEYVSFPQAKSQLSLRQINLLIAPNGNVVPITMSCDLQPFKDARVRQAMRLIADRRALVGAAQLGFGDIGNDLFGKGYVDYDNALPQRAQDLEKARYLLKQAGMDKLQVTLYSSKAAPGMLESATAFAEQAKSVGVTINVHNGPADSYYSNNYLKWNFGQTQWSAYPIATWMQQALLSNAPYNETHWYRPAWDRLFNKALGALDMTQHRTLMFEVQRQLWDEGGYLMWGFSPQIDGLAKNVRGAYPNPAAALGAYDYRDFWLA